MAQVQAGYLIEGFEEELISTVDKHVIELRTAMQEKLIKQAEIVGIEEFTMPTKRNAKPTAQHCAVLDYNGIVGYIPLEDMDKAGKVMSLDKLRGRVGTKIIFTVTRMFGKDAIGDNDDPFFVGSRKAAQELAAKKTFEIRHVGDLTKAAILHVGVKHIIVDLGGIESNIHVSELSHGWIDNMYERFRVGELIDVKILSMDSEKGEIKVSHKAALPNNWDTVGKKLKINKELKCVVSGVTEAGVFLNIAEGVDAYAPHLKHEFLNKGDEVLARVIQLDVPKRTIACRIVRPIR